MPQNFHCIVDHYFVLCALLFEKTQLFLLLIVHKVAHPGHVRVLHHVQLPEAVPHQVLDPHGVCARQAGVAPELSLHIGLFNMDLLLDLFKIFAIRLCSSS